MRYIITKVSKGQPINFGSMFGSSNDKSSIQIADEKSYDTYEDAKNAIQIMEDKLNEKCDSDWEKLSDNERERIEQEVISGKVYETETFMVIPVEAVLSISSRPKHLRG